MHFYASSNRFKFFTFKKQVEIKEYNFRNDAIRWQISQESPAYREMQYAIALEMKYKRLSHSLAEAVVLQKQFTTALSSCCVYQSNVV